MAAKKANKKRVANAPKGKALDADFKRRSKAAKKGWKTRKRNVRKLKNAKKALKEPKVKAQANPGIRGKKRKAKPLTKKQLLALVRKQEKELIFQESRIEARMNEALKLDQFYNSELVNAVDMEYIHRDGHIALQPSRARWDADYELMRKRLQDARDISEYDFDYEAYTIAEEYDYEVREIYTLFFS